jgi:hypothetical protein
MERDDWLEWLDANDGSTYDEWAERRGGTEQPIGLAEGFILTFYDKTALPVHVSAATFCDGVTYLSWMAGSDIECSRDGSGPFLPFELSHQGLGLRAMGKTRLAQPVIPVGAHIDAQITLNFRD